MIKKYEPFRQNPEIKGFKEDLESQIASWKNFYNQYFDRQINVNNIKIPERTAEEEKKFKRLIIIPEGLTLKMVYDKCKENFPCVLKLNPGEIGDYIKTEEDWNREVDYNDRDPKKQGTYAVWVENQQETNERNTELTDEHGQDRGRRMIIKKNKLKDDKDENQFEESYHDDVGKDITLLERILYELKYFNETGDHLDKNKEFMEPNSDSPGFKRIKSGSYTICSGTGLGSPHCSPIVEWHSDKYGMFIHYKCFMRRIESSRPVVANKDPE